MITTLGFLSLKPFWDPDKGETGLFGELSTEALTSERGVSHLTHATNPERFVTLFSVKDEQDTRTLLPADDLVHMWTVLDWVADEVEAKRTTSNKNDFEVQLRNQFAGQGTNFTVGEMVAYLGTFAPAKVKWEDMAGNRYEIWLSDATFKDEYQGGEVQVIPLLPNTATWFLSKNSVQAELAKVTPTSTYSLINQLCVRADGSYAAYTSIAPIRLTWYEKGNSENYLETEWTVVIYGRAKNNPEDIKKAIMDYLLANSSYKEPDWIPVFPEIFNPTEFMLIPLWAHYARKPSEETAIHQPMVLLQKTFELMDQVSMDYTLPHIQQHLEVVPNLESSISLLAVGSPKNQKTQYRLHEHFGDYFLMSPKSADWSRMEDKTQNFVNLLHTMLFYSKTMTSSSKLPSDLYRVYRHGRMFLVGKTGDITLMMLTRVAYMEDFGDINNVPYTN